MRRALVLVLAAGVGGLLGWPRLREATPQQARALPPPTAAAAPQAAAAPPSAVPPHSAALELLALQRHPQGRPYARLRDASGQVRSFGVGDSLAPGQRLVALEAWAVEIEQGGQRWRLVLPPEAPGLPAAPLAPRTPQPPRADEPLGPIAVAADAPLPSSTRLERAIRRASTP